MISTAVISECGKYRYRLDRIWDSRKPKIGFIMLNPSTADGSKDDPTIRKCIGFVNQWGGGHLIVGNLYAYRATDPKKLAEAGWPVGDRNLGFLRNMVKECQFTVLAWGANVRKDIQWASQVSLDLQIGDPDLRCLATLADGIPGHPLMLAYKTPLKPYA